MGKLRCRACLTVIDNHLSLDDAQGTHVHSFLFDTVGKTKVNDSYMQCFHVIKLAIVPYLPYKSIELLMISKSSSPKEVRNVGPLL